MRLGLTVEDQPGRTPVDEAVGEWHREEAAWEVEPELREGRRFDEGHRTRGAELHCLTLDVARGPDRGAEAAICLPAGDVPRRVRGRRRPRRDADASLPAQKDEHRPRPRPGEELELPARAETGDRRREPDRGGFLGGCRDCALHTMGDAELRASGCGGVRRAERRCASVTHCLPALGGGGVPIPAHGDRAVRGDRKDLHRGAELGVRLAGALEMLDRAEVTTRIADHRIDRPGLARRHSMPRDHDGPVPSRPQAPSRPRALAVPQPQYSVEHHSWRTDGTVRADDDRLDGIAVVPGDEAPPALQRDEPDARRTARRRERQFEPAPPAAALSVADLVIVVVDDHPTVRIAQGVAHVDADVAIEERDRLAKPRPRGSGRRHRRNHGKREQDAPDDPHASANAEARAQVALSAARCRGAQVRVSRL